MNEASAKLGGETAPDGLLDRLRERRGLLLICLLVALIPVVLICITGTPRYSMNPDDNVQALYASNRFMNADAHLLMPYTLVVVSAPLAILYQVLPQVPWYPLLLLALTVFSFGITLREAVRVRAGAGLRLSLIAILLACEVVTTWYLTYTIVAFLAMAAGLVLLLAHATFDRPGGVHPYDIGAYLLIAVGFALRPESGLATLIVFFPFAVWVLVRNRNTGSIVRAVLVIAIIAATQLVGTYAYDSTPGWETYSEYLDAGRLVMDSPHVSTDAIQSAAPQLSDNDVTTMYDWDFIDEDVFGTGVFESLSGVINRYSVRNLLDSLTARTTYLLFGLAVAVGVLGWVISVRLNRDARLLAMGVPAMLMLGYLLIIMRGRPRLHVVIPLAVIAVFALIICAAAPSRSRGNHLAHNSDATLAGHSGLARGAPLAVCLLSALACTGFWITAIRPIQAHLNNPIVQNLYSYVQENPDQIVLFGHTQSAMFGYDAFSFESWEYPDNAIFMGGWESHTAPWYDFLEDHGLSAGDTLLQLVERDDMVAVLQPGTFELLEAYLEEHTGRQVEAEVLENFGPGVVDRTADICAYRFSAVEE